MWQEIQTRSQENMRCAFWSAPVVMKITRHVEGP